MKVKLVAAAVAVFMLGFFGSSGVFCDVGVVNIEGGNAEPENQMLQIAQALGYDAELIRADLLPDSSKLASYRCVILIGRGAHLYEEEYDALAGYVRGGGTLLIVDSGPLWRSLDPEDRYGERTRTATASFNEAAGSSVSHVPGIVKKFKVVKESPYTQGIPEEFTYEMRPGYDMMDERSRWRTECYAVELRGAEALVNSVAFYDEGMEAEEEHPFMTFNSYGSGNVIRIAARVYRLVMTRQERHILQMVSNVLRESGR